MKKLKIKIKRAKGTKDLPLPQYQSAGAAGMDLHAAVTQPITVNPGETKLIPTGIFVAIPGGYEAQIRPRSGLALKHGITVLNTPGTVDSDYRGEVFVILINLGKMPFTVNRGDRIAQMVISPVTQAELEPIEHELPPSNRGNSGFGDSGI